MVINISTVDSIWKSLDYVYRRNVLNPPIKLSPEAKKIMSENREKRSGLENAMADAQLKMKFSEAGKQTFELNAKEMAYRALKIIHASFLDDRYLKERRKFEEVTEKKAVKVDFIQGGTFPGCTVDMKDNTVSYHR